MTRALREALVADHEEMYARSPSFRFAVDQLAGMLPAMVNGMVIASVQADREYDVIRTVISGLPPIAPETIEALRRSFTDPPQPPKGSVP